MITNEDIVDLEVQKYIFSLLKELGIKYSSISISENTKNGNNIICSITKVCVDDTENRLQYNLVIKSGPTDEAYKKFIQSSTLCHRELYVYTNVLPKFEELQKCNNVQNPFRSYPKFFGSKFDDIHETIVLQDLTADGYKVPNRTKGLDYKHVSLAMKEYGKMHALSYALRDQNPQQFREISKSLQENFFSGPVWNNLKLPYESNLQRAFETIDAVQHKQAHEKCVKFLMNLHGSVKTVLKAETASKYAVIGHGDCWCNNMLFKYDNRQDPTNVCFIDWQLSRLGSPALDLSYFMFASTDKELRDKHYDQLIREYHNSLCSFYTEVTGIHETCLSYEILQEHLRKFSIYGLLLSIQAINLNLNKPKDCSHNIKRGENVLSYESTNMTEFNTRVKDMILDYDKLGYAVD